MMSNPSNGSQQRKRELALAHSKRFALPFALPRYRRNAPVSECGGASHRSGTRQRKLPLMRAATTVAALLNLFAARYESAVGDLHDVESFI